MTYTSILTHVQTGGGTTRPLEIACDLAHRFGASLTGVAVEMLRAAPFSDGYCNVDGEWFTAMRTMILDDQKNARCLFDVATAKNPGANQWIEGIDFPADSLARESRGADLIVTGHPSKGRNDPYKDAQPAELALKSGRPVLVVPDGGASFSGNKVVLGWKDTREARRAMSDAMPFLKAAEAVLVVEVCGPKDVSDALTRTSDVVHALGRHGVNAEARSSTEHLNAGLDLVDQARLFGADLIVSGAYGHSRMGEWVFGGVTHELLAQKHHFVLLSH